MKKLYFTRHGQTVWNVENKICGATESPLTEQGRIQAKELAEKIRTDGLQIHEILHSPLSRARDTAQIISAVIGVPMREEPRLIEQNFGCWEGTPRDGKGFAADKRNFICSYGNGESMFRMAQRIYNLLDDIRKEPEEKVCLLVAHNGIARIVESYFRDMGNEEFATFGVRNCQLVRYEFKETKR